MALKRPDMSKPGPRVKCCDGPNKGKMFDSSEPCDDPKDVFKSDTCECVECTEGDDSISSVTCQKRGFNSCYVCRQGKCVKGPKCCSNLPGRNAKNGCGVWTTAASTAEPPEPDEDDCCANEWKAYLFSRPRYQYGSDIASRYLTECKTGEAGPDRMWFLIVDCEELYIEAVTKSSRLSYNGGWPDGLSGYNGFCGRRCDAMGMPPSCTMFTFTEYRVYAVGPQGNTRVLYSSYATQERYNKAGFNSKLKQKHGETNFYRWGNGAYTGWPYQPVWRDTEFRSYWVIAAGTYNQWAPNAGAMSIQEYPTCWPYEDRLARCYCSGSSLQRILDGDLNPNNTCSICYANNFPPPQ